MSEAGSQSPPSEWRLSLVKGILLAAVVAGVWLVDGALRGALFHLVILAGLSVGLVVGVVAAGNTGRARGGRVAFLLYGLLEHRAAVYTGGALAAVGATACVAQATLDSIAAASVIVATTALAGVALGFGVWRARTLANRWVRAAAPVATLLALGLALTAAHRADAIPSPEVGGVLAANIGLALPLLCVLVFIARTEDTGLEIAAICVTLGAALWFAGLPDVLSKFTVLIPALLWFVLTTRIEKPLHWLKAVLAAEGFMQRGDHRAAVAAYVRAAGYRPKDTIAQEGVWSAVRHLGEDDLVSDEAVAAAVPIESLLVRARQLRQASPSDPVESHRLLRIVARREPADHVDAWLELARFQAERGEWDEAAASLGKILDADTPRSPALLAETWCVALTTDELAQRLGRPLLAAGRRMEAILALERGLPDAQPPDALATLKRSLYAELPEAEYRAEKAAARSAVEDHFDHAQCRRLAREWASQPERFARAVEMFRIARDRLEPCATTNELAALLEERGDIDAAMTHYEETKTLAARHGALDSLPKDEAAALVAAATRLAAWHEAAGRLDEAIDNHRLINTPRRRTAPSHLRLARLEQRRGRLVAAINEIEQALMYDAKSTELLDVKRGLYAAVSPEAIRAALDQIRPTFDFAWCLAEGKTIAGDKRATREELDFGRHLLELAAIGVKDNATITLAYALGRTHRRLGDDDTARRHLESARDTGGDAKTKLPRAEDDAYRHACRLLAEIYLDRRDYEAARDCLLRFRPHLDSGADTYFKLGQIEEALGHPAAARKQYDALRQIYPKHPLAAEARAAAERLAPKDHAPRPGKS